MKPTEILFLGVDSVTPVGGDDTASFVINRTTLVDTGWCCALRMQEHGLSPLDIDLLLFTHLHHDHYLGLPSLLFHRWQVGGRLPEPLPPLTIAGPAADLERVVDLALQFLQCDTFKHRPRVELRPLEAGDGFETDALSIATSESIHPVAALCYRVQDKATGTTVAFTGDTAPHAPLAEFVRGADLFVHEASHGERAMAGEKANAAGHSGAPDAARLALDAEVKRLALVHAPPSQRDAAVRAAQTIFPATFWPQPGERVLVES